MSAQENDRAASRVYAILQIRLDGAEAWDVRDYIAQKEQAGEDPWKITDSETALTAGAIDEIIQAADAIIIDSAPGHPPDIARQLAMRRNLYARAVAAGEIATANRILDAILDLERSNRAGDDETQNRADRRQRLLQEIHRRHLEIADADSPDEDEFEHGPLFSPVHWFNCAADNAERMRWTRAMCDSIEQGLVTEKREKRARCSHVRLTELGEQAIEQLAGETERIDSNVDNKAADDKTGGPHSLPIISRA